MEFHKFKKIAITGGKGGTGKSTVAILFANKLVKQGKNIVLCDCDTECPNDYLLLGQKLVKPKKKVFGEFPKLIKSKCKKCGLCVKACKNNAIFQPRNKYPMFIKDLCLGCGACWAVCPYGAIKPIKQEVGRIYLNKIIGKEAKSGNLWLVTGLAKSETKETKSVTEESKNFALNLAEKIKADIVLFDTAAGTHCPVISVLISADIAYAVTEPTPMGAYDLSLILELCKKLKVPVEVILNQANLGNKQEIEKIIKKSKTKMKLKISYSKELALSYSKGRLLKFNVNL